MQKRLANDAKNKVGEYQCRFLKEGSTIDAIHLMKQIKCNIDVKIIFIDSKYNSTDRSRKNK